MMTERESILDYPMSSEKNVQEDKIDTARIINRDDIPNIDTIMITAEFVGRIDTILLRKYNRLDVLPIILDYNNKESINDFEEGDFLFLPDIGNLNDNTEILQELDTFDVPGMAVHGMDTMTKEEAARMSTTNASKNTDGSKVTAVPKLDVTMNRVKYEPETGKLIF